MYTTEMELTATDFRKNLFHALDQALRGEQVEISYKGAKIRLTPPAGSKLTNALRRPTLLVDPDSIVESDTELIAGFEQNWVEDDHKL